MDKETLLQDLDAVAHTLIDENQLASYWRLREYIELSAVAKPRKAVLLHREKDECND